MSNGLHIWHSPTNIWSVMFAPFGLWWCTMIFADLTPCKHGAWCISLSQQIAGVFHGSFYFFLLRGKPKFSEPGARNPWNGSCFCDVQGFAINATSASSSNHRQFTMVSISGTHPQISEVSCVHHLVCGGLQWFLQTSHHANMEHGAYHFYMKLQESSMDLFTFSCWGVNQNFHNLVPAIHEMGHVSVISRFSPSMPHLQLHQTIGNLQWFPDLTLTHKHLKCHVCTSWSVVVYIDFCRHHTMQTWSMVHISFTPNCRGPPWIFLLVVFEG